MQVYNIGSRKTAHLEQLEYHTYLSVDTNFKESPQSKHNLELHAFGNVYKSMEMTFF